MPRELISGLVFFPVTDLPPATPDTPEPAPRTGATATATATGHPDRRRSSLLSRPSVTAHSTPPPSASLSPTSQSLTSVEVNVTASPIASTSTASPFGTTLTHSAPHSTAPDSLARVQRYPVPQAPEGFRHPQFMPGYGRQSMGSPGIGRRASAAASALGYDQGDDDGDDDDGRGSFGVYAAGRRSEVHSDGGNVSVGTSEGFFDGSRSVRTSLAVSVRSSFGMAGREMGEGDDDDDDDGEGEGGLGADGSLSLISAPADEEVTAFNQFKLSDESDSSDEGDQDDRQEDKDEGDYGDEEGARALSDPAGIDWDDVLRDVGEGGGDDEEEPQKKDYYGDDIGPETVADDGAGEASLEREPFAAAPRLPKPPPLAKVAVARKKRALPRKFNRSVESSFWGTLLCVPGILTGVGLCLETGRRRPERAW